MLLIPQIRHNMLALLHKKPLKILLCLLSFLTLVVLTAPNTSSAWSFLSQPDESAEACPLSFIGDVYLRVSPAVVCIDALTSNGAREVKIGSGSGLIFDPRGYVITNYHVVADCSSIKVSLADGRSAKAVLIGAEPGGDLALLQIELDNLPTAKLGDSNALRVGDVVFPIGNPGGEQFARSMTMGVISGIGRQMVLSDGNLYTLLQTDAAINPGNSGGPLVDYRGLVIGVNSVKIVDEKFESMGFAIPINSVREFISTYLPEYAPGDTTNEASEVFADRRRKTWHKN